MELICTTKALERHLLRCLDSYDKFSFATAWASADTNVFRRIQLRLNRLQHAVIGIHFFQTDPDVLDAFVRSPKVRFMLQPGGVFHPKALVFWSKGKWEIFVGSANLTKGGLGINTEVVMRIESGQSGNSKHLRKSVQEAIASWFDIGEEMTPERAREYRETRPSRLAALNRVAGNYGGRSRKSVLDSCVMTKPWADYCRDIVGVGTKKLDGRLGLLKRSRQAFASAANFAAMDPDVRRMIAGLPNDKYDEWGWFGSMKGAGKFWTALNKHVLELSEALEHIPLGGDVSRDEYNEYISGYHRAFPQGRSGIATATRLLAMKRPDQFVCLDGPNKKGLCKDFGITVSGMNYDRYWDEIIERVRDTPWWNAPPPSRGRNRDIWQGRAAMLDAIFYKE